MDLVKLCQLFKTDEGETFQLTPMQEKMVRCIARKEHPRNIFITCTQYGKSTIIALGIILRMIAFKEKWAIVAPSEKKAKIVMNALIGHLFDSPFFFSQLEVDTPLEKLKQERSKNRLTFKKGGEVYILSADSKNKAKAGDALMGFGASCVALDESALIDDDIYSKVFRMLGGRPNSFLVELGNPFNRNHFLKSWHSPRYNKVFVDWRIAVAEGRIPRDFIEEMRDKQFFDIFYECKFPEPDSTDKEGYTPLITDSELKRSLLDIPKEAWVGVKKIGVDVGHGRNASVILLRVGNFATILEKNYSNDSMVVASLIVKYSRQYKVKNGNIFVDAPNIGGGVIDRLKEHGFYVNAVNTVARAMDSNYKNMRAEQGWRVKEWLGKGGKLDPKDNWTDLLVMKYIQYLGQIKLMSKERMLRHGIDSPDVFDAMALTFNLPVHGLIEQDYDYGEKKEIQGRRKPFDRYSII